jgi:cytidine deaminase
VFFGIIPAGCQPGSKVELDVAHPIDLLQAARTARENAHARYSGFKVGAAVEDEAGRVFTGCNIENATYGLTLCAERLAVFKAVSEGAGRLVRVAVVADTDRLTPPCGACRQILWEFCPSAELLLGNLTGATERLTIRDIFPRPFDDSFL